MTHSNLIHLLAFYWYIYLYIANTEQSKLPLLPSWKHTLTNDTSGKKIICNIIPDSVINIDFVWFYKNKDDNILALLIHKYNNRYILFFISEYVYCGSSAPLYSCKHAWAIHKTCTYAICNGCNESLWKKQIEKSQYQKRQRRNVNSGKHGLTEECNHPNSQNHSLCNLVDVTDDTYFTSDYLNKKAKQGHHVPFKCAHCNKKISNKNSIIWFFSDHGAII